MTERYPHVEEVSSILCLGQQIMQHSQGTWEKETKFKKNEMPNPFIRQNRWKNLRHWTVQMCRLEKLTPWVWEFLAYHNWTSKNGAKGLDVSQAFFLSGKCHLWDIPVFGFHDTIWGEMESQLAPILGKYISVKYIQSVTWCHWSVPVWVLCRRVANLFSLRSKGDR